MISVIILTHNEERNIIDCLDSVKWCDEILVIDDNSEDRTVELAKKEGALVFSSNLNGNFSRQRNFGLSKAKGDWILFVDADERITDPLRYEIQSVISDGMNPYDGFRINRKDVLWGKQLMYGETGNVNFLRLCRKNKGIWSGKVHEVWKINGKVEKLKNSMLHYPHQSVEEFLKEINFYTDIRAEELYEKKVKSGLGSVILYPKAKFFLNFFIKQGFRDGIPGLVFALMMSFHSFLVRSKLWMMWQGK